MAEEYTIAVWAHYPFTSYDKRGRTVEHRVRVVAYDTGFVDVLHERNERYTNDGWVTVEVVEVRDQGVRYEKRRDGVLSE